MGTRLDNVVSALIGAAALTVVLSVGYRTLSGSRSELAGLGPAARAIPALSPDEWAELVNLARPLLGDSSAGVTVVEFVDLECPACRVFHGTLRDLPAEELLGVRVLVAHFPLPMHRFALPASRALECAAAEDRTLPFVDVVYQHQDSIGLLSWGAIAHRAGLSDTTALAHCALDPAPIARISQSIELGTRIGVTGTPTLFVNGIRLPSPTRSELLNAVGAARGSP